MSFLPVARFQRGTSSSRVRKRVYVGNVRPTDVRNLERIRSNVTNDRTLDVYHIVLFIRLLPSLVFRILASTKRSPLPAK